jgi:hypothetical protein
VRAPHTTPRRAVSPAAPSSPPSARSPVASSPSQLVASIVNILHAAIASSDAAAAALGAEPRACAKLEWLARLLFVESGEAPAEAVHHAVGALVGRVARHSAGLRDALVAASFGQLVGALRGGGALARARLLGLLALALEGSGGALLVAALPCAADGPPPPLAQLARALGGAARQLAAAPPPARADAGAADGALAAAVAEATAAALAETALAALALLGGGVRALLLRALEAGADADADGGAAAALGACQQQQLDLGVCGRAWAQAEGLARGAPCRLAAVVAPRSGARAGIRRPSVR